MIEIRQEKDDDVSAIYALNVAAFDYPAEAKLVDKLRDDGAHILSLVAVDENRILGHVLFSSVTIHSDEGDLDVVGLAPMGVYPNHQRAGIGGKMIAEGIRQLKEMGYKAIVLLGHPEYYPRFGFRPSHEFGIEYTYKVPPESFMVLELEEGILKKHPGVAKYHLAFDSM